jgi:hypothetical protein
MPTPTPPASPADLRASFVAARDGAVAAGQDAAARTAEIALRDTVGTERGDPLAGWIAGSQVDLAHQSWYPSLDVAAQGAQYWAAEEGRGGVAHPPGSVPWPATAWRDRSRFPAPAHDEAPAVAGPQAPWLWLGIGAVALGSLGWWAWRRSG